VEREGEGHKKEDGDGGASTFSRTDARDEGRKKLRGPRDFLRKKGSKSRKGRRKVLNLLEPELGHEKKGKEEKADLG